MRVSLPTAPAETTDPPVPPLWDAQLDTVAVEQLFAELAEHAEVLAVTEKGGARSYTSGNGVPLAEACARLVAAVVRAVQVRYRYQDKEWCDTLLQAPGGIRLVRCLYE